LPTISAAFIVKVAKNIWTHVSTDCSWHSKGAQKQNIKLSNLLDLFFCPLTLQKTLNLHCFAKFLEVLHFTLQQAATQYCGFAMGFAKL